MIHALSPISRLTLLVSLALPAALSAKPPEVILTGYSGPVIDVAFSRDGTKLAAAGDDGKLRVWDIASKKELFTYEGIRSTENNIRFSPDGRTLAVLGSQSNVAVIDAATGKVARSIALTDMTGVVALDVSPDGAIAAVVGRGKLRLLDLATGATRAEYAVHAGYAATAVAFSADGRLIATAGTDKTALVVDASSGKVLHKIKIRLNGVAVYLSLDGKTLFVSSSDQALQSLDLASGAAKTLVEGVPIFKVSTSKDGKTLVIAGVGHGPVLFSLPEGARAESAFDSDEWVKSGAISPDSHWLAGGGNGGSVFLWKNGN